MAYDLQLAGKVRAYLAQTPNLQIEEKKMFAGLAFMINGKMCINISGNRLMIRFDPALTHELQHKTGYQPMVMKGKVYKGYCYVEPAGFKNKKDFAFWLNQGLAFNDVAKSSKKK